MGIEHLSAPARIVWELVQARDLSALPPALAALDPGDRTDLTRLLEVWSKTLSTDADPPDPLPGEPDWVEATWSAAALLAVGVCPGVTSAAAILRRVQRHLPYVW